MQLKDGDLMTLTDAGKVLGVSRELIRKLTNAGRIPFVRTAGGVKLIWAKDARALADARAKAMKAKGNTWGVSLVRAPNP